MQFSHLIKFKSMGTDSACLGLMFFLTCSLQLNVKQFLINRES